jgi:hypothetical protein
MSVRADRRREACESAGAECRLKAELQRPRFRASLQGTDSDVCVSINCQRTADSLKFCPRRTSARPGGSPSESCGHETAGFAHGILERGPSFVPVCILQHLSSFCKRKSADFANFFAVNVSVFLASGCGDSRILFCGFAGVGFRCGFFRRLCRCKIGC